MELDDIDRSILRILQADATTPFSEVARRIDMSSATVHERVDRLEAAGVIEGYHAEIDPTAVGFDVDALVGVRVEHGCVDAVVDHLESVPFVEEIHATAGTLDLVLRVHARDEDELRETVFEELGTLKGIRRTNSMVVLSTTKDTEELPL